MMQLQVILLDVNLCNIFVQLQVQARENGTIVLKISIPDAKTGSPVSMPLLNYTK